ncbi:putative ribonuclease H-like domain-containing protein, partial [Tanacetum coccineum]
PKIPEFPWGSPVPIGDGDGDVNRFPDGDGDGDGDEAEKRGWGYLGPNDTFTVKDARYMIDQNIISTLAHATTWDKSIPRKKIVSRLAILGVVITQEDLNSNFLRSLPPEWNTHVVVWMNKADIETMSIDDFTANFSDNTVYAFMVENPNGSNLLQQDLEQIHEDDLEAIDLKWHLSLLSLRAKRYFQRTGKKIFINANDTAGYGKSKLIDSKENSDDSLVKRHRIRRHKFALLSLHLKFDKETVFLDYTVITSKDRMVSWNIPNRYTRVNLRRCIYSERIKSVQDCIYCCQFGKFASYFAFIFQGVGKVKPKSANDDQKQTRRKTKSTSEQGFLSAIYEEKTHDTLNTCLYACFLSKIEPTSIAKALSDSSWVEAMQEELLQFKLQQGHRQEEGIDYEEVFAPVARIEAIRLFLAYDSFMGFMVYQMDVKSAFLYGTIEGSLRESQRFMLSTHQDLKIALNLPDKCNGFKRGKIDQTLFIKKQKGDILLVQVYVDDIIFGSTNKELYTAFEKLMKDKFQMSSTEELTFFLGLQVTQKEDEIFISQDKYVAEILKKFNYTDVKFASTPVDLEKPLVKDGDADDVDVHLYRPMIGSLMYLTRLGDIMFCKKQTVVATSTAESEYVAAASCCGQVLWIQNQLLDYGYALTENPTIYVSPINQFWRTTSTRTLDNGEIEINATVDVKIRLLLKHLSRDISNWKTRNRTRRMGIRIPQSNVLSSVADEAITKEMHDGLGRATTTTFSLEVKQGSVLSRLGLKGYLTYPLFTTTGEAELHIGILNSSSTKVIHNKAFITLTKRVKKLEKKLKLKRRSAVIDSSEDKEASFHNEDSSKQGRMIKEINEDENVNLVKSSKQGEAHDTSGHRMESDDTDVVYFSTASPQNDDDEVTLAETFVNIKMSATKDKAKSQASVSIDWSDPDHVLRYLAVQKGFLIAVSMENMCIYLKNQGGYKHIYFKGMSYEDIIPIFERVWDQNHAFVPKDFEIEKEVIYDSEEVVEMLNDFDRKDLIVLYRLFNEKYASTRPGFDDLMLWGDMKIMFEPNDDDVVWKNHHSQELIEWKLYDSCGVRSSMLGEVLRVLVTCRSRFGVEYSDDYDNDEDPIPFKRRVFPSALDGKPITGKTMEKLIDSELFNNLHDDDDVSLCCIYLGHFKTWIWELFRVGRNEYYKRQRRYPRVVAWSSNKKFYRNMLRGTLPVERLTPDEIEARSDWWVSRRAYFDGLPSEIYRQIEEEKRAMDQMLEKEAEREKTYEKMHKFMQGGLSSFPNQGNNSFFEVPTRFLLMVIIWIRQTSKPQCHRILNILNRARREAHPSMYMLSPYTDLPPSTVVPKKHGDKTKNKSKNANLSAFNLGNAFDEDNVRGDDLIFLGEHDTGHCLVYENVDPSKVRREDYIDCMEFMLNPYDVYLECYMMGYMVPDYFCQQLVPHLCMPGG